MLKRLTLGLVLLCAIPAAAQPAISPSGAASSFVLRQSPASSRRASVLGEPVRGHVWEDNWNEVEPVEIALSAMGFFVQVLHLDAGVRVSRWIEPGPVDAFFRDALASESSFTAHARVSDVLVLSLIAGAAGMSIGTAAYSDDARFSRSFPLIALRSFAYTGALISLVKRIASRRRPFCEGDECAAANESFFSGHSAYAFTAASLICTMSRQAQLGSRGLRIFLCGLSVLAAAAVPMFRMTAGRHYFSDVLVGSAVGVLSGFALPRLITF